MTNTAASANVRGTGPPASGRRFGGATVSDWLLSGLVLVIGGFLLSRGLSLPLPLNVGYLGPQWFPIAVGALLVPLAFALAAQAVRRPVTTEDGAEQTDASAGTSPVSGTDWRAFSFVVATLTAHVLVLSLLGWIPAGIVLFWGVARAMGSNRALFDLGVAAVFSCTVQVAFTAGLGIALPVGALVEGL